MSNYTNYIESSSKVVILDGSLDGEAGMLEKRILRRDIAEHKPTKKVTHQDMLDSLFNSETGESHKSSDEIMMLITSEYQCEMMEQASGNGAFHPDVNPESLNYANGVESQTVCTAGLANMLVDSPNGLIDKNKTEVYEQGVLVEVDHNSYSLWDTIADKCALIVRRSGHWNGKGGTFEADKYEARAASKLKAKHKRLMTGFNNVDMASRFSDKALDDKASRKQKRLDKKASFKAMLASNRELNQIGYNATTS